ncbi:MAG: TldD/PmbA family protein [Firmicutes bacterium]|nr:TldD/PmbA family protein [Bacillota bacterium]MDD4337001.1 TldD/PmbA family protein [Bacillota bacterium]MDD4791509.1 TldD/PmbA family protein [Bacillota bacterium]
MTLRVGAYTEACNRAMERARELGVYAIVRIQDKTERAVGVVNGRTDLLSVEEISGVGVQVFTFEGYSGFASSDVINPESLVGLVESATNLACASSKCGAEPSKEINQARPLIRDIDVHMPMGLDSISHNEEERLVSEICRAAMEIDQRLAVRSFYRIANEQWRIVRSDGTDTMFSIPRSAAMNMMTARGNGRAASANASLSGADARIIASAEGRTRLEKRTRKAALTALALLEAPRASAGSCRVVIDYALAKGLAHEAFGHAAECDGMETSILGLNGKFRKGHRVASEIVNIVDGPVEGDYAYQPISANGILRETVEIVRRGELCCGLSDVFSAERAGVPITGAARAESYRHVPVPRMTNIRITVEDPLPISKDFEDVTPEDVRDVLARADLLIDDEPVLYLSGYKGGQVNPAKGDFVFNCTAIYELTPGGIRLLQPAIFSGKILSALGSIIAGIGEPMIDAMGTCGKAGQAVPSSGGGNMFLVIDENDEITIGGV